MTWKTCSLFRIAVGIKQMQEIVRVGVNPHRSAVLHWYKKILTSAFVVDWKTDDDAAYVMQEARKVFRDNMGITDVATIERKVQEAEQRYLLAVHYKIPYPRMFHKLAGGHNDAGVAYASYLDSHYDQGAVNPRIGKIEPGSVNDFAHCNNSTVGIGSSWDGIDTDPYDTTQFSRQLSPHEKE